MPEFARHLHPGPCLFADRARDVSLGAAHCTWGRATRAVRAVSQYYIYIMTNRSGTLYTGVTSDLQRRVWEHKHHLVPGFTSRYRVTRLVYYEATPDVRAPLAREKQIKGWLRAKKMALIESVNPGWRDLSEDWGCDPSLRSR